MSFQIDNVTFPEEEFAPRNAGRIVARFDVVFPDLVLTSCAYLHRKDKGWTVWGPGHQVKFSRRLRREIKHELNKVVPKGLAP
ncbi:hypothetical protein [Halovulum sp. GXIMD14793]